MSQQRKALDDQELSQEVAQDVPDRDATSVLHLPISLPLPLPIESLPIEPAPDAPVDELPPADTPVMEQLPSEAGEVDLQQLVDKTLGDGDPLDALPPDLRPETQQITEDQTISNQTSTTTG